ncbi:MAG TPA: hypothetical protein VFC63_15615 [Blastocatellia bacterium]|nr:hypothetical protein [Blastocatellia bacterium]
MRVDKIFQTMGSIVLRCQVIEPPTGCPSTVIVKKVREDQYSYRPDSAETPNAAHALFSDWAALEFLNQIGGDPPLAPCFYGGSRDSGLILLEDLGDSESPTTIQALQGDDPELAERMLLEHVALIGQLHAKTIGQFDQYNCLRSALGPAPRPGKLFRDPWSDARLSPIPDADIEEVIFSYRSVCQSVGVHPDRSIGAEIEQVAIAVEQNPEQWLAFCKGDQNEAGDYIRCNGRPRFFDFDGGGFRHALIEGVPGRMTWGCMMRLPSRLLPSMERAYRNSLSLGCPAALDDLAFSQAMIKTAARWHILHVIHRLQDALAADRQRGPTTLRQQTVAWIEAFANLSTETGLMSSLGKPAREIAERLRQLWNKEEIELPYYPVFRESVESI